MEESLTIPAGMSKEDRQHHITDIINSYSRRLLGFIRRRVNNEADAEDILQDVFYQFVGNTEPIDQVTSWLFTVARNKIIDRQRKKKTASIDTSVAGADDDLSFDWDGVFLEESDHPETTYLRSVFWEVLDEALRELPDEQREVFVLNEIEDMSFKEISEKTGVGINTLLSRKRYAVLHLRDRLQTVKNELLNY